MAMVKLTPDLSFENHHLRDTSFSPYLKRSEETFVHKLEGLNLGKIEVEDEEISVFGAEKYFNEATDEDDPRITNKYAIGYQQAKDEPVDTVPVKPKIPVQTPSVRSSESSLNSQSALLQGISNPSPRKANKKQGKRSLLAGLACKCYCSDKNSVEIDEHAGETNSTNREPVQNGPDTDDLARTSKSRLNPWLMEELYCKKVDEVGLGLNREDVFQLPIVNNKWEYLDGNWRKSLEVFGSPVLERKNKSLKLSMLGELETPAMYNDAGSDASSDLFEIESFPNTSNQFPTCYTPSEASIEWSVVTASAADFSIVSDSEDPVSAAATTGARKMGPGAKTEAGKGVEKRLSRIVLLGCKSQRAVRVAGDNYRVNEKLVHDCEAPYQ
ncbi:Protein PHYTOCHROME KINASE SUBSTRATE like [Actinidia chinensis var. chinensis]|uniref:Protein PHYTOCHROME KINASE SUBSTRATE like n=1 Tax=Actinidia chinensis var. chinensis TaxID=1590841 RepID=A0A2R6PBE5_ACTCC|nr:Protein PHYTOCHROME KINASE SUBSTRATE like [Actinidia chinensis var. chinensis]